MVSRDATYNFCQKTNHISTAWLKRKGNKGTRNRWTHKVNRDEHDDDTLFINSGVTASEHKRFCISQKKKKKKKKKKIEPLLVLVSINGKWIEMEIDTDAAVSLISHTISERHWLGPDKPLSHMAQKLVTFTGENITPCGTCEVTVTWQSAVSPSFGDCTRIGTYTVRKKLAGGNQA